MLNTLAEQNRTLADLQVQSDRVLAPLARRRERVSSFIDNANATAQATAERRVDIERSIERLPRYLSQLRPVLGDLETVTDEFTPVLADLRTAAPDLARFIGELGPFSRASVPALQSLGDAADVGRPALERTRPLVRDLSSFAADAGPVAQSLDALTKSLDETGGVERAMDYLFFQMMAVNGFDGISHYLRAALITNLCSSYAIDPAPGCNANFKTTRVVPAASGKRDATLERLRQALGRGVRVLDENGKGGDAPADQGLATPRGGRAPAERPGDQAEARAGHRPDPLGRGARRVPRLRRSAGDRPRGRPRLPPGERRVSRGGRGGGSLAASPVLVGALTTLVLIVAIFLSYNANSGLPFVPTYDVDADLPNAANLVVGNEVRIGGFRVGVIDKIDPIRRPGGATQARIHMKLQKDVEELPVDSNLIVRSRSALGLKYLEITPGKADKGFVEGSRIPIERARPEPVEFDTVINTFDKPTREGQRGALRGFGEGLAGRGIALNETIGILPELFSNLEPVMTNLAASQTQLRRLFPALDRTARIVAPVAETQAALFGNLDTTFAALSGVARPYIQETISRGPAAMDAGFRGFPTQRVFLQNFAGFARDLRPGAAVLPSTLPDLADALEFGEPALRRSPELNRRLSSLFVTLGDFSTDPIVNLGVNRLQDTVKSLRPTLSFLAPIQTTCNYVTLWFRNIASLLSEGDKNGTWQRFIIVTTPQGPNSESGPSSGPANGPTVDNYLHANNYPNTASPGQTRECEAANEDYYQGRQVIGNVPGNQGTKTAAQPDRRGTATDAPRRQAHLGLGTGGGRDLRGRDHRRLLLRLHEGEPVLDPLRAQGDVRERHQHPHQLARARRGRRGRQGHEGRVGGPRLDGGHADHGDLRQRPAAPQGRLHEDPPADLPRGQLLRRAVARLADRGRACRTAARSAWSRPTARCRSTRC